VSKNIQKTSALGKRKKSRGGEFSKGRTAEGNPSRDNDESCGCGERDFAKKITNTEKNGSGRKKGRGGRRGCNIRGKAKQN